VEAGGAIVTARPVAVASRLSAAAHKRVVFVIGVIRITSLKK
jgi:hypothetical protein